MARRHLIGLDIDTSSVRMIQLRRRNSKYTVVGAAVRDIAPAGGDPDGQQTNTIQAISDCLDDLGQSGKLAICGLRGPEVFVRGFEFPALPPEEIEGAVGLETVQMCPFNIEDGLWDHQVTSESDTKTHGFWVAATRELIEARQKLMREGGLQCALMDIDGLALLNCLEHWLGCDSEASSSQEQETFTRPAILDISGAYATIATIDRANRPFIRDVCLGENEIVKRIANQSRRSTQVVRAALLDETPPDVDIPPTAIEAACRPLVEAIVTTLRYYTAENRNARVDRLLVCGRFALARGFVEWLDSILPFEVVLWNPIAHIQWNVDERCETLLHHMGSSMAVAAGLAMRTV